MKKIFCFALLLLSPYTASKADLLPPTPAEAPAPSPVKIKQDMDHACRADVEKFCKGVSSGKQNALKCLKKHKKFISLSCKGALKSE